MSNRCALNAIDAIDAARHVEQGQQPLFRRALARHLRAQAEQILDDRLRARMSGSLGAAAGVEQVAAAFDRPPPKRTMPWVYIPRIARKVFAMPTKKWAIQVVGLLGGLTFAAWCSPSSVGSVLLLNTLSCAGWMYNRGTPDVVRDDYGQIGEIRPMKPKPMAVFGFQSLWLEAVMKRSGHPTVEKTVRIVVDYYRKVTNDAPGVEAELFWRRRGGR